MFDRAMWWYEQKPNDINNWEYIPNMSEIRLNQINDELKAQGFKCPEIRAELEYREKCRMNNIVLDMQTDNTEIDNMMNIMDDIVGAYDNDDALVDDIYSYPDINGGQDKEVDFNPICLELDSRFEFVKQ